MRKQKLRSEIEDKYKWDLSDIYVSDKDWEADLNKLVEISQEVKKYEGHILDSSDNLLSVLNLLKEHGILNEKIYVYATLKKDEDSSVPKSQNMVSEVMEVSEKCSARMAFVNPEILEGEYSIIETFYLENEGFNEYKFLLERLFKNKEHLLTAEQEELLTNLDGIVSNFEISSEYLRDQSFKFGFIHDESGNEVELTLANYPIYIKSHDRNVRKEAYQKYTKVFEEFNTVLATNYIGHLKYSVLESKLRKYDSVLEIDTSSMNMDKNVFHNLINIANEKMDVYRKYVGLIKKVINVDEMHQYDLSVTLASKTDKVYSFEDCKEILLDCFKIYGEEYLSVLKKAFDENWIDVYNNKSKRTGWYSCTIYKGHPHVLGNYNSQFEDVSILAHELGHAVNGYLSVENNPYFEYSQTLFEAEVASLTNELILGKYLLNKTDNREEKLEILDNMLSLFVGNFFGGVRGGEFEYKVHTMLEEGETLTPSILNNIWEGINDRNLQDTVVDKNTYGWSRVPHFFIDYYYYKYATGIAGASYISEKIINNDEGALESYLEFLKAGTSKYPIDLLKIAGIDMNDPNVIREAIDNFDRLIDQFIDVYNS